MNNSTKINDSTTINNSKHKQSQYTHWLLVIKETYNKKYKIIYISNIYKSSAITNSNYKTIKVLIKNEMTQNIQVQKSPQQNTMLVQLSKMSIVF